MFDYTLVHWTTFLGAAALLNVSPGPDIAFILGHTVRGGRRTGATAMLGIWTGAFGHVALAAAGLSALVLASAALFSAVKWLGVAYLLWIGLQALLSRGSGFATATATAAGQGRLSAVYRQGILINLLNPKVALFFVAFLPQFVEPGAGPVWAQLLLHGSLIVAVAATIEPPLVLLGDRLTRRLRASDRLGRWLDRALGTLLIALGVRLALIER